MVCGCITILPIEQTTISSLHRLAPLIFRIFKKPDPMQPSTFPQPVLGGIVLP